MFKLPSDVVLKLEQQFPQLKEVNIDMENFIHVMFHEVMSKTLQDGNCTIRELGRFTAFINHSNRVKRDIVRLKFKVTQALLDKIKYDPFLLTSLTHQESAAFTKKHAEKCKDKKIQKKINTNAQSQAIQTSKQKTDEAMAAQAVRNIINE